MSSFLTATVDDAEFDIGPEINGARDVAVTLKLDGQPAGRGLIVAMYVSEEADGQGRSASGEAQGDNVFDSHYQTDANSVIPVEVQAPPGTYYLVVVTSDGSLAVSDALAFTV